jgi:serine/threonine protein kinase
MSLSPSEKVGPYEILAALGAGGMGEVYRARDSRLERDVAIKVLLQSFAGDPDRLRRFQQEARALATLNHPNIVAVYEIGEYRDSYYMVSELLEGETLREALVDGPLSQRRAIEYASQIAEGLAAAHDKGVVHRDLKPENIFVTKDQRVKILDFGLAKLARTDAPIPGEGATATVPAQTMPGMVLGTAGYMSPEQVRGKEVDARTDIFAFGAILYEILSGRRAFRGESSIETMNAILKDDPPELEVEKLKLSPGLERIVRRCLEKEPSRRFQSARDVGFALEAIFGTSSASTVKPQVLPPKRPRWLHAAALALLFIALVAAGYFAGRRSIPATSPSYHQLTFESGYTGPARFTRDGNTVVYSAAWNGGPRRLYTQRSRSTQSKPLEVDADVLGIADDGEMAVILKRRFLATGDLRIDHDPLFESIFTFGSLLMFTVLAIAAIACRRRPDIHKRLMLFANIALMVAPLAHFIGHSPRLAAMPGAIIMVPTSMFLIAAVARDYWLTRKVSPLTLGLAVAMFLCGPLEANLIGPSQAWHRIASWLVR